jgi:hypothetical protein
VAGVLVLMLLFLAGCAPASTASPQPTATSPQPTATDVPPQVSAYTAAFGDSLSSVSMNSASEGWAVGDTRGSPLLLHNAGDHWDRITNAIGGAFQANDAPLTQVVMVSATEGWAVGSYHDLHNNLFGLVLHYTGGRWMPQKTLPNVTLNGLAMLSASEGWAVGATYYQQGVLLHYTGGTWNVVSLATLALNHIVMTSPTDGWIVGQSEENSNAAWHYDGTTWTEVAIPGMTIVSQIAMVSASDGWAVGYKLHSGGARNALAVDSSGAPGPTVFAHYDGKTWTAVQTFTQDMNVTSLSLGTPKDGWAVGTFATPDGAIATTHTLYLHYTGGRWKQVDGPDDPNATGLSVVMLSASDGWAVSDDGAILRYQQNAWKTVVGPGSK